VSKPYELTAYSSLWNDRSFQGVVPGHENASAGCHFGHAGFFLTAIAQRNRRRGAAAFAAVVSRRFRPRPGERVGVLVSGGNTVAVDFDR
jgi:hypothetical protein